MYNDPTILHSAECQRCGREYADGDILDANGICPECVDEMKEEEQ